MGKRIDDAEVLQHDDAHVPRYEPWIGVATAAFIPLGVMFILPPSFLWPMVAAAGLLLLTSIVILIRQERRAKPET